MKGFVVTGSNAVASIEVQGSNDQVLDNQVSGNTNGNGSEIGVRKNDASYANNVVVSGNVVSNSHGWSNDWVLLQVDCIGCDISNNDLSGSDIDVLRIWGHDNAFHGNYVHDIVGSNTAIEPITGQPYCLSAGAHADIVQVYGDCGSAWCQTSYNNEFYDNVAYNLTIGAMGQRGPTPRRRTAPAVRAGTTGAATAVSPATRARAVAGARSSGSAARRARAYSRSERSSYCSGESGGVR